MAKFESGDQVVVVSKKSTWYGEKGIVQYLDQDYCVKLFCGTTELFDPRVLELDRDTEDAQKKFRKGDKVLAKDSTPYTITKADNGYGTIKKVFDNGKGLHLHWVDTTGKDRGVHRVEAKYFVLKDAKPCRTEWRVGDRVKFVNNDGGNPLWHDWKRNLGKEGEITSIERAFNEEYQVCFDDGSSSGQLMKKNLKNLTLEKEEARAQVDEKNFDGDVPAYIDYLLKTVRDEEQLKALRTFKNCVLPTEVEKAIYEAITFVLSRDKFEKWGVYDHFEKGLTNAILLYGPPGTGKTMVSESIAAVLGKNLLRVGAAEINSSAFGQSEKNIKKVFTQAKENNAVILFDECDSLLSDRNMMGSILGGQVNTLLSEIERFEGEILFTTNRIHRLDPALERRILNKVRLMPPPVEGRKQIWQNLIPPKVPVEEDINYDALASIEFTGGEIKNCVLIALRKLVLSGDDKLSMEHLSEGVRAQATSKKEFADSRPKNAKGFAPSFSEVKVRT